MNDYVHLNTEYTQLSRVYIYIYATFEEPYLLLQCLDWIQHVCTINYYGRINDV